MKKRSLYLFLALITMIFLLSCSSKNPAIIKGMAFDKAYGDILLTADIVHPGERTVVSVNSDTISGAISLLTTKLPEEVYSGQNEILLLSDELSPESVERITSEYFTHDRRKGSELVFSVCGKAGDTFDVSETQGIVNILETDSFKIRPCTISAFTVASNSIGKTVIVPMITIENGELVIDRAAVYKDHSIVDIIYGDVLLGSHFFIGDARGTDFSIEINGSYYNLSAASVKAKHEWTLENGTPVCYCNVKCSLLLMGRSSINNISEEDINIAASDYIKSCIEKVISNSKELDSDYLGIGTETFNLLPHFREFTSINDYDFIIDVECYTNMSGIIMKPDEDEA